jgi:uncharacterized protein YqjF (DUF2071 family)
MNEPLTAQKPPFLTAGWRWLAMMNFEVPPEILRPWLPRGVELDPWHGKTLVSLVGFRFLDTRVMGVPIREHRDFDEVNLRFFVSRKMPDGWRKARESPSNKERVCDERIQQ